MYEPEVYASRQPVDETHSRQANQGEWDRYADEYQATHGTFLGDAGFMWGPEGLTEDDLHVLPDPAGLATLEVGCGAGQCSRWLAQRGAHAVGLDVSERQLHHARRLDDDRAPVQLVLGTATHLPFEHNTFDVVFSAFGALQFIHDIERAVAETARVLKPGGLMAFSITHPVRWSFPDDPGPDGLTVSQSYWDRTPYVETTPAGHVSYVEHHRTLGDWVRLLSEANFRLEALHEPQWPAHHDRDWGGWSRLRGTLVPGTAIFCARQPLTSPMHEPL